MKVTINQSSNNKKLSLTEALKYESGTLFKFTNSTETCSGVAVVAKDNVDDFAIVHFNSGPSSTTSCLIFYEDPHFPFAYELIASDQSVTLGPN